MNLESRAMDLLGIRMDNAKASPLASHPYIIRDNYKGRGLFSLVSGVVCHIHLAKKYGLVPVVDMRGDSTEYNEKTADLDTDNAWEYYFEPVSALTLDVIKKEDTLFFPAESYPSGYPYSISHDERLVETFRKHIQVKSDIQQEALNWWSQYRDSQVVGVHWRAQEQRTSPNHWFPPNTKQITACIDYCLSNSDIQLIFAVSEEDTCINILKKRYGTRLIVRPHYRSLFPINAYKIYPRPLHKYLLGREILIDVLLLSFCNALIRCTSNVAQGALLFKNGHYEIELKVNNGPNKVGRLGRRLRLSQHLWNIKNIAPEFLGGFSLKAIEHHISGDEVSHPFIKPQP